MSNKRQILEELIEEHGLSPWQILSKIEETENVNSDEDPSVDENVLSDEDKQNIAQGLVNDEIDEKQFQKMIDDGQISEEDAQEIMQMAQSLQGGGEMSPEEQAMVQISQVQDMTVRFSLYEKFTKLEDKIDYFLDYFTDINTNFYKSIEELREYVDVVSNLIFNLEINLLYQLYFQIESKLIELFEQYLAEKEAQSAQ